MTHIFMCSWYLCDSLVKSEKYERFQTDALHWKLYTIYASHILQVPRLYVADSNNEDIAFMKSVNLTDKVLACLYNC